MNKLNAIAELKQRDIDFCNTCKKKGAEGWVMYFVDNGVMATSAGREDIIGKSDIYKSIDKIFKLDDVSFTWEPVYCDVSEDFTMGHTSGTSRLTYSNDGEKVTRNGKYSTIWKKVNGEWKIILDLGN